MKQKLCKVGDVVITPAVYGPKQNLRAYATVEKLSVDGTHATVFVAAGIVGWRRTFRRTELKIFKRKTEVAA